MTNQPEGKVTIPSLIARKATGPRIVALTAYDYPTARILDERGVDIILVGDSLGMVVLGYENTLPVTMEDMLHHTRAVARGVRRALVAADMPYFSFHLSPEETIRNASRFLKEAGAEAVKIEGASKTRLRLVEAMVDAEIPVMGHVGLTPQSIHAMGRYRVTGVEPGEARRIIEGAADLERAGAFAVVLESVPLEVAGAVTEKIGIPTIGIGAGPRCDGQVLVFHDMMGYSSGYLPKFVKVYADLHATIGRAVERYAEEVRLGTFPDDATSYHLKAGPAGSGRKGGRGDIMDAGGRRGPKPSAARGTGLGGAGKKGKTF
jgi:3-methyl-2-oxobutanoate hydroxymethyltransferase